MNTNLMCSACFKIYFKKCSIAFIADCFPVGYSFFTITKNTAFNYTFTNTADWQINCSFSVKRSAADSIIILMYFTCQLTGSKLVFSNKNKSRCITVKAVYCTESSVTVHIAGSSICKRITPVISAFVNRHKSRLIKHKYILVVINRLYIISD